MIGWIKLHRSITEHWVFQDAEKFKRWIDILLLANHEGVKVNIGNDIFECNRGQSIRSLQSWAERWKCSKGAARNFLELLEKDEMVTLENLTKTTRLTICNYDSYQDVTHAPKTHGERTVNASKTHGDPNKNDNNENNEKEEKPKGFSPFDFFGIGIAIDHREPEAMRQAARYYWVHGKKKYDQKLFEEFLGHWEALTEKGKMLWKSEKTFNLPKRLSTWHTNSLKWKRPDEEFTMSTSKRIFYK